MTNQLLQRCAAVATVVLFGFSSLSAQEEDRAATTPAGGAGIGGILVAPTRVVLEGNDRAAEVTLLNTGIAAGTYRISFINLIMGEDGRLREVPAEEAESAVDSFVRYSPRQVTLDPEVAQTIRLSVRKPAGLAPGEYRSHLLFRAVPDPASVTPDDPASEGLQIRLIPVYGVSIPVIVRHETTGSEAGLADLTLADAAVDAPPVLNATLERRGDESIYGDLIVTMVSGGETRVIGELGGVAIYPPNSTRPVQIPLVLPEGVALADGNLELEFRDGEDPAARREMARATLPLPSAPIASE